MARPRKYTEQTRVFVCSRHPEHTLQRMSERRAIVNLIIDNGGVMKLWQIDEHFGYDTRAKVASLVLDGWLAFDEPEEAA